MSDQANSDLRGASQARFRARPERIQHGKYLRDYSRMSPLEVWYNHLDMERIIAMAPDAKAKTFRQQIAAKAQGRVIDHLVPKIVSSVAGRPRIVDQPPLLFHPAVDDFEAMVREGLEDYRNTLSHERRILFDRYRFEDAALKVVGIGSIGTRCLITLFFSENNHPLILQFKEARRSVLEPTPRRASTITRGNVWLLAKG
jgi:hypothetical protein